MFKDFSVLHDWLIIITCMHIWSTEYKQAETYEVLPKVIYQFGNWSFSQGQAKEDVYLKFTPESAMTLT